MTHIICPVLRSYFWRTYTVTHGHCIPWNTDTVYSLTRAVIGTVKKKGTLRNLKKRFSRWQKVCKCVQCFKKRIKKNTEPLKDLTVYPSEDPFFSETFLSSVDQKIGFVGKYETFRVSYWTSRFRTGFPIKLLYLIRNSKGFVFSYKTYFLVYGT